MWLALIAHTLALSAMAPATQPASSPTTGALPEPIATRQTLFEIPFRIDGASDPARTPAEVQLYVSGDRGASWQLYSRVDPARGRFRFRAGVDGEFWFMVRTLDRSGQLWPKRPEAPELKVIVDTMPPKLQLQAEQGQAGQITARWQIDDPNSKPEGLSVQYRTTADGPWQQVAVDRRQQSAALSPQSGEVTWWPQAGSGTIQIRAEVTDTAGNLAVSHAQVTPQQSAQAPPSQTAQGPPAPWRASAPGPDATTWPAEQSGGQLAANRYGAPAADQPAAADDRSPADGYPRDQYAQAASPPATYPDTGAGVPFGGLYGAASALPAGLLTSNVNPPIQNQYAAPGDSPAGQDRSGMAPAGLPRMVNSSTFQLEYSVSAVGPSGVSKVELWATQDGGRTWNRLATDDDNLSPLVATVQGEGTYGLKVVVTGGDGLGGGQPLPGELPEVVIGVDLTKPTAQITAAEQGTGPDSGKLVVCWQADDQRLAARPISLLMSDRPGGPWTTVAAGLDNTGRYAWPADGRLPQQLYLRLEARDEAGNVGTDETPQPISLYGLAPPSRMPDDRPPDEYGRRPATGYYIQ